MRIVINAIFVALGASFMAAQVAEGQYEQHSSGASTAPATCPAICSPSDPPPSGYGLYVVCLSTNGRCPPNGAECGWQCRTKIVNNGQSIPCPHKADGTINYDELYANPQNWPECAEWHLPPDSPTWTTTGSGDVPGDGQSEGGITRSLDCGTTSGEVLMATAAIGAFVTAQLVFNCGGNCN